MAEAPLKTRQVINLLFIKSIKIGDRPHLITCAPSIQTKGFLRLRAETILSISKLKSEAFKILGREFKKPEKFLACHNLAKFPISTLLFRVLIEIVLIFLKSISRKFILIFYFPYAVSFKFGRDGPHKAFAFHQNRQTVLVICQPDGQFSFMLKNPGPFL